VCEPVSTGAVLLGGLSAGSSALGAIGRNQSAQAQAAAQNRSIANQANQRNRQYELDSLQGIADYNQQVMDVSMQQDEASLAAMRAFSEEDLKLQDAEDQIRVAQQEMAAKRLGVKTANEGGRSRSYGLNDIKEQGRAEALLYSNLERQTIASYRRNLDTKRQADAQRQKLFTQVANPYRSGPAPSQNVEFVKGPSKLGLVAELGGAVVDGVKTTMSLTPPTG
jgi:hypothetical protein